MAGNPLVDQGTLNRLKATLIVTNYPALTITPSFLGRAAISMALEGDATGNIETLTGVVTSPQPYLRASLTANLLKSQGFANQWKIQMELNTLLGPITVTPDSTTLGNYTFANCSIRNIREMTMSGEDPGFVITLNGIYYINSSLWG